MPAASGSSLVRVPPAPSTSSRGAASSLASPARPFRVGSDGLPLLPCHEASVVPQLPVASVPVELFGHVDSAQDIRRMLQERYHHSTEMTLRIDTELELLRRSCFAQRNSQWGNLKPDQFAFVPVTNTNWSPQTALQGKQTKSDGHVGAGKDMQDAPMDEFVRDRAWPPQEFALKPLVKPKGKGGRRKAVPMAAVLDPIPVLAKTCKECRTQSTPLWRTQTRQVKVTRPKAPVAGVVLPKVEMEQVLQPIQVDLCLKCFLKLERKELFDHKLIDKKKQDRKRKEQAAVAALLEKKRLKQQIQVLRKQEAVATQAANHMAGDFVKEEEQVAKVILKFTREEIQAATGSTKDRKKDRKHSRKDKKKKRKRRHKHEQLEDSESEGPTPMPSPPQMDGYVYADRELEPYATPSTSAFDQEPVRQHEETFTSVANSQEIEGLEGDYVKDEALEVGSVRSSSRKRKTVSRASPARSIESPASASKKRKTSAARTPRSKRAVASAAVPAPVPAAVAAPTAPAVRKRPRTKKELARERELRALGQYCPVCNEVYEDDDQNTFVCCDSCELWVHGACDPSLTQEAIAAMANTDDKYICPLCAGR